MSRRPDSRVATHYKNVKSKEAAHASSQRFTAKQSQFSRKEEEKQVMQNIGGGSGATNAALAVWLNKDIAGDAVFRCGSAG